MSKKLMLLAAGALSVLAFAALPSIASAGEWECETDPGEAVCGTFEGVNNTLTTLTQDGSNTKVECTQNTVHGSYSSKTTGSITITFHNCTSEGVECHSAGQSNGTIVTFHLTFHNIMLEGSPNKTPGVLLTPNAENGEFATFVCGGIVTVHVRGNGLVGDVTKSCGESVAGGANIPLDFTSAAQGTQRWTQVTTTGTVYDLSAVTTFFGTTTRTGSQDGEGSIKFAGATKITCP